MLSSVRFYISLVFVRWMLQIANKIEFQFQRTCEERKRETYAIGIDSSSSSSISQPLIIVSLNFSIKEVDRCHKNRFSFHANEIECDGPENGTKYRIRTTKTNATTAKLCGKEKMQRTKRRRRRRRRRKSVTINSAQKEKEWSWSSEYAHKQHERVMCVCVMATYRPST